MKLDKNEIRHRIAKRIAEEFMRDDSINVINLGVGIPTLVADYVERDKMFIQTENGMLGVGEKASEEMEDRNLINAGRIPITETKGCSYFDSATSFGMIRGGHIDATAIGALEVDEEGSVANWIVPNTKQLGVGGAMDLVTGVKKVFIATRHTTSSGASKLVKKCTLPITGHHQVDVVVTELAVFHFIDKKMVLKDHYPDVSIETIKKHTEADFEIDLYEKK